MLIAELDNLVLSVTGGTLLKNCFNSMSMEADHPSTGSADSMIPSTGSADSMIIEANSVDCEVSAAMVAEANSIDWKVCEKCKQGDREDCMVLCDVCDKGYHIDCLRMAAVPKDDWVCMECELADCRTFRRGDRCA